MSRKGRREFLRKVWEQKRSQDGGFLRRLWNTPMKEKKYSWYDPKNYRLIRFHGFKAFENLEEHKVASETLKEYTIRDRNAFIRYIIASPRRLKNNIVAAFTYVIAAVTPYCKYTCYKTLLVKRYFNDLFHRGEQQYKQYYAEGVEWYKHLSEESRIWYDYLYVEVPVWSKHIATCAKKFGADYYEYNVLKPESEKTFDTLDGRDFRLMAILKMTGSSTLNYYCDKLGPMAEEYNELAWEVFQRPYPPEVIPHFTKARDEDVNWEIAYDELMSLTKKEGHYYKRYPPVQKEYDELRSEHLNYKSRSRKIRKLQKEILKKREKIRTKRLEILNRLKKYGNPKLKPVTATRITEKGIIHQHDNVLPNWTTFTRTTQDGVINKSWALTRGSPNKFAAHLRSDLSYTGKYHRPQWWSIVRDITIVVLISGVFFYALKRKAGWGHSPRFDHLREDAMLIPLRDIKLVSEHGTLTRKSDTFLVLWRKERRTKPHSLDYFEDDVYGDDSCYDRPWFDAPTPIDEEEIENRYLYCIAPPVQNWWFFTIKHVISAIRVMRPDWVKRGFAYVDQKHLWEDEVVYMDYNSAWDWYRRRETEYDWEWWNATEKSAKYKGIPFNKMRPFDVI